MAKNLRNNPPSKLAAVRAILGGTVGFSYEKSADTFHFPHGGSLPPQAGIDAKLAELTAEYKAQDYARKREMEYPSFAEQLDHIYHNGIASWKENVVKPIKDKYPKPE